MDWLRDLGPALADLLPLAVTLAGGAVVLAVTHAVLVRRERRLGASLGLGRSLTMLAVTALVILAALLALPVGDTLRGQLLGLLGLVLTGVIAISSTTFVANAMAGLMLRAVGNFRPGDWVQVGDQFGRVTERGLFHTEIQTEDRDLATLPNLFLVTNPVKVVRASGTVVSTTLSLGYGLDHARIEELLGRAADGSGLSEPFVYVVDLGDFAVTYRVAGFLADVRHLLSARSRLRTSVLDTLHAAGVEIVSPTFMNQRRLTGDERFVPPATGAPPSPQAVAAAPEEIMFDKAARQASLEELRAEREALESEIQALERGASAGEEREPDEAEIARKRVQLADATARLEAAEAKDEKGDEE